MYNLKAELFFCRMRRIGGYFEKIYIISDSGGTDGHAADEYSFGFGQ